MPKTPEVLKAAVTDAANEKLDVTTAMHERIATLAKDVATTAPASAEPLPSDVPLTVSTRSLLAQNRTPAQIAAATLEHGYPQAA